MKFKIIGAAIVIFWLVMMFTLVRDRLFSHAAKTVPSEVAPALLAANWKDYEEWMGIYYKGLPIGAMTTAIRRDNEGRLYYLTSRLIMEFKVMSFSAKVNMALGAKLDDAFVLKRFLAKITTGGSDWTMSGLLFKGRLLYRIQGGGRDMVDALELESPPSLLEAVRSTLGRSLELKVGRVYQIPVYDPVWSSGGGMAEVRVVRMESIILGEKRYNAFRVEITLNKYVSVVWLDNAGRTLMRQLLPDVMMKRAEKDEIIARHREFAAPVPLPGELSIRDFLGKESTAVGGESGLQFLLQDMMKSRDNAEKK